MLIQKENAAALNFSVGLMVVYFILKLNSIKSICFFIKGCCGGCPNGYTDMGCTCFRGVSTIAKSTYGRGVGSPLICPSNKVQSGALCYDSCRDGFNGIGPVCWGSCPGYYGSQCGALCVKKASDCAMVFKDMTMGAVSQALNLVAIVGSAGTSLGAWVNTYSSTASLVVPMLNDGLHNLIINI